MDSIHVSVLRAISRSLNFVVIQFRALLIVVNGSLVDGNLIFTAEIIIQDILVLFAEESFVIDIGGHCCSILQNAINFFATRVCVHFPHKCVGLGHNAPRLAVRAICSDHLRVEIGRLVAPDDPFFH